MYKSVVAAVDLSHAEGLEKALATAADIAKHYGAALTYLGVTTVTPGPIAHSPEEFQKKLEAFAKSDGEKRGIEIAARSIASHDPAVDLDETLVDKIKELGADLVVMASHMPHASDHIFTGHAPYVATHAPVTVMVVR